MLLILTANLGWIRRQFYIYVYICSLVQSRQPCSAGYWYGQYNITGTHFCKRHFNLMGGKKEGYGSSEMKQWPGSANSSVVSQNILFLAEFFFAKSKLSLAVVAFWGFFLSFPQYYTYILFQLLSGKSFTVRSEKVANIESQCFEDNWYSYFWNCFQFW